MRRERVYLDWNATAPLRAEARDAMIAAMDVVGNPSSVHGEGRAAKAIVERARLQVAELVGCQASEIVFTSGATEAARILGQAPLSDGLAVDPMSHDALWAHAGPAGPREAAGQVIAMGLANSETGVIADLPELSDPATKKTLFLDVTQAVGRIPWSFAWSGVDFACLSAHKLGGPKGVGALVVKGGAEVPSLQPGGGQEMGRRSGTENVIGIAGFGAAAEAALAELNAGVWGEVEKLRNILESTLAADAKETIFVGKEMRRLSNTSCFATPGWKGETQVMQMDLAGFAISSGSACSSGKVRESRVLKAMGFDEAVARSAVRVSLGPGSTEDEVLRFAEAWREQERKFRQRAA